MATTNWSRFIKMIFITQNQYPLIKLRTRWDQSIMIWGRVLTKSTKRTCLEKTIQWPKVLRVIKIHFHSRIQNLPSEVFQNFQVSTEATNQNNLRILRRTRKTLTGESHFEERRLILQDAIIKKASKSNFESVGGKGDFFRSLQKTCIFDEIVHKWQMRGVNTIFLKLAVFSVHRLAAFIDTVPASAAYAWWTVIIIKIHDTLSLSDDLYATFWHLAPLCDPYCHPLFRIPDYYQLFSDETSRAWHDTTDQRQGVKYSVQ